MTCENTLNTLNEYAFIKSILFEIVLFFEVSVPYRRINIPKSPQKECDELFNVATGTLRHHEQHTKSWTKTEQGKI